MTTAFEERSQPTDSPPDRPARLPLRGLATALFVISPLLVVAAIAALIISWNISADARDQRALLTEVRATVLQTMVKPTFVPQPLGPDEAPIDPATGMPPGDWEYLPEVLLRFQQEGETVEQWIEIEAPLELNDHWRAQQAIARYRTGEEIKAWYDDSGAIQLKVGDGGRQMLLTGRAIAAFLVLPAFGLLLAGVLLLRLARRTAAADSAALMAVPESAVS